MAVVIKTGGTGPSYKFTEKLWLAADQVTVVPDGDPAARSLLGTPGKSIPMARAIELGLTEAPGEELPEYYEDMKVDQLKAILAERDLPVSGTKDELVARLVLDDEAAEKDDEE